MTDKNFMKVFKVNGEKNVFIKVFLVVEPKILSEVVVLVILNYGVTLTFFRVKILKTSWIYY